MRPRFRIRLIDVMIILAIVACAGFRGMNHRPSEAVAPSDFLQQVDLSPLFKTAVHADGRLRSFESHASTYMRYISGPRSINRQPVGLTYLDMLFRPEQYADTDIIYVKNKNVRAEILDVLQQGLALDQDRAAAILRQGLFSKTMLGKPAVVALLQRLGRDLIRTGKDVDAIHSALTVADPAFLVSQLNFIPPPSGNVNEPWRSIDGLTIPESTPAPGSPSASELARSWTALRTAWRDEDATRVNAELATLAGLLPAVAPTLYPSLRRLALESWYFRSKSMTWVWLIYLAGVVPLLISAIYRWDRARKIGMGLFLLAFIAHSVSLGIRWYISGRWPNANMFEAVTTTAWFGGVTALILEWITRRTAVRNLFALGSSLMSMGALMAAYYLPAQLDPGISNKMAALNDVWLYIHTNMILVSYATIGLACIPALLLLRHRWCALWDEDGSSKMRLLLLPPALGTLHYTGYLLLMHFIDNPSRGLAGGALYGVAGAFGGSVWVIALEILAARARRVAGVHVERSASGGAAALFGRSPSGSSFLRAERPTATEVFDAATMVLVELSFIMLWTGVVMGAIWADHSWGRPWGWDPKEVFALNTFIIFLILIHRRFSQASGLL